LKNQHLIRTTIAIGLIATTLGCARSEISQSQPKTFLDWCQQYNTIARDAQQTVAALLEVAKNKDCQQANKTLQALTRISFSPPNIENLQPLSSLINLQELDLENNQIVNIEPLATLSNLRQLHLKNNKIKNVKALQDLNSLTWLDLSGNSIEDLRGIDKLANLTYLQLDKNKIVNVSPLSNLNNLTALGLSDNQISDVRPLAKLRKLQSIGLRSNRLTLANVRSLNNVPNLSSASLEGNGFGRIKNLTGCPIAKPGISCIY
jgi:internalin A